MSINYDKELNNLIKRTVKNFNAKVRYNKTKTRGKGMLPEKISAKDIKDKYSDKSRAELMNQLKLYQSFGKRDALDKTTNRLSKWERDYFEANRSKTLDFYTKEISDLKRIIGDKNETHLRLHDRLLMLERQREAVTKDLSELTETQIKGMRGYYEYAERSDIVKAQGFRHYLNQLERTMNNLGYTKDEINALFNKFNQLSENEFLEMTRNEDLIDAVYDLVDSPKGRGEYELMTDEKRARAIVNEIENQADFLVNKYKSKK